LRRAIATAATGAFALLLLASTSLAQVYVGEDWPGALVGYDGTDGAAVNPDTPVPGVTGLTLEELGRLLITTSEGCGDVLLFDIEAQTLDVLDPHQSHYVAVDVYPDPADSSVYVIKNGDPHDDEGRCDSYLGVLLNGLGPAETIYTFGDDETLVDLQVWPMGDRAGNILVLVKDGCGGGAYLAEFEKTGPGSFVRLPDSIGPEVMVPHPGGFAITPGGVIVVVDRETGLYRLAGGVLVPFGEATGPRYTDIEIESDGTIYLVNSHEDVVERYDAAGARIEPDLTDGINEPSAVTAASFAPTPEGEYAFVEPIDGVEITFEEVTMAGFTSAVAGSSASHVSPLGNILPEYATFPGGRADKFVYIGLATDAVYRSLIQVDVMMEGSRLFYASGVGDTFRDFTVVGSIDDARGTMPRFTELTPVGGRLETGPTEIVLVEDLRPLPQVTLYKFWRLAEAMSLDEVPDMNSCPWQVIKDLQIFRERARADYDGGDYLNAMSELAVLNAILRDHAGWCVPDMSDDEELGNLVGRILAHSKTLLHSIELESGGTFTGIGSGDAAVSLSASNPARGKCTIELTGPVGSNVVVRLYSVSGRLVDTLFEGRLVDGAATILWDGTAADGHRVASGAYFAMAESDGARQGVKLIYVR
jgi:hypothetical protein